MVLLELFAAQATARGYELTVAHFDHGMRAESAADAAFVAAAAARLGLPFASQAAGLGAASEAAARAARHGWLEQVRVAAGAAATLTGHHQDDLLETSLLNLARGTGRLGLAPMPPSSTIGRPLRATTRAQLRAYAATHRVAWREDSTNADLTNPRNLLRHRLLPSAPPAWQPAYLALMVELSALNTKIDQSISDILNATRRGAQTYSFPDPLLQTLTLPELEELILAAARALHPGIELGRPLIMSAAKFAVTGRPRKQHPLRRGLMLYREKGRTDLTNQPV